MKLLELEIAAVIAAAALAGFVIWKKGGAAARAVRDAAPAESTAVDIAVAGSSGALGELFGLPTPREISEDRGACANATNWFEASKRCSAPDFVRWLRGDFGVSDVYPDESIRGSRAASSTR